VRERSRAWPGATALAVERAHTLIRRWNPPFGGRAAMRAFQSRKLRALVAHCRAHVGVYRDHWRAAATAPEAIEAPEALGAWPTIRKEDLRTVPLAACLADGVDPRGLVVHRTSGSSGEPFAVHRTPLEEQLLGAFRARAEAGAGLRPFDRVAVFRQWPEGEPAQPWLTRVRRALRIHREVELDGLADAASMVAAITRHRPDAVRAYPSTMVDIATWMLRHRPPGMGVKRVLCGGEVLGAAARRTIAEAFAVPIVDFYGAHEFNLIASECPSGFGYPVSDDNVLVEVLGDDGRPVRVGESGDVVVTALHSYAMPFVRYRTGDLAVRGSDACECGAPWSTLRAIQGRAAESLRLPGGRRVHPYRITGLLAEREAAWVAQHQLVQSHEDRVVLALAVRRAPTRDELERVRASGAEALGADVRFDVTLVEGFPTQPGRKFRPYVPLAGTAGRS
jgi:phenylacetate-CoA ligase